MPLPPTIPTSFVPHVNASPARKFRSNLVGIFSVFSYTILGIVFVLALGVFFYSRYLTSSKEAKDAALASAQAKIDPAVVEGFTRLRDRLTLGRTLIDAHPAFSGFFSVFENTIPSNVRFKTLHLSIGESDVPTVEGSGVAQSFNALAVASDAFATDGRIKDAIFSNISVNKDKSVSFTLSATLDPRLIAFALSGAMENATAPVSNVQETATSTPLP